jgi:hypothetical protein
MTPQPPPVSEQCAPPDPADTPALLLCSQDGDMAGRMLHCRAFKRWMAAGAQVQSSCPVAIQSMLTLHMVMDLQARQQAAREGAGGAMYCRTVVLLAGLELHCGSGRCVLPLLLWPVT